MSKESKQKSVPANSPLAALRQTMATPKAGQVLSIMFGLLFLFQCMLLPLVGKAAMGGSGSPGAGAAGTVWQNQLFFLLMLLVTLAVGSAAFYAKQLRRAVVELIGVHRFHKTHIVHHRIKMRQAVGHPCPGLAILLEGKLRPEHLRGPLNEGELFSF